MSLFYGHKCYLDALSFMEIGALTFVVYIESFCKHCIPLHLFPTCIRVFWLNGAIAQYNLAPRNLEVYLQV
jgi:hypothetical protein